MRAMRGAATALLALVASGCFVHQPVAGSDSIRVGTPVRVQLVSPGAFDLGELTAQQVVQVEGEVVAWSGDTLTLSASRLVGSRGNGFAGNGTTVFIPGPQIETLLTKRISPWHSVALGGGILAAILLTREGLSGGTEEGPPGLPGGGNPK